eukprot:Opistho-2@7760
MNVYCASGFVPADAAVSGHSATERHASAVASASPGSPQKIKSLSWEKMHLQVQPKRNLPLRAMVLVRRTLSSVLRDEEDRHEVPAGGAEDGDDLSMRDVEADQRLRSAGLAAIELDLDRMSLREEYPRTPSMPLRTKAPLALTPQIHRHPQATRCEEDALDGLPSSSTQSPSSSSVLSLPFLPHTHTPDVFAPISPLPSDSGADADDELGDDLEDDTPSQAVPDSDVDEAMMEGVFTVAHLPGGALPSAVCDAIDDAVAAAAVGGVAPLIAPMSFEDYCVVGSPSDRKRKMCRLVAEGDVAFVLSELSPKRRAALSPPPEHVLNSLNSNSGSAHSLSHNNVHEQPSVPSDAYL